MSCGHEGCTCGPDHTGHDQHDHAHGRDLPVQHQTAAGDGGCCGQHGRHEQAEEPATTPRMPHAR